MNKKSFNEVKCVLFLFFMSLLIGSCKTTSRFLEHSVILDFSRYSNNGFFITEANSVNFNYKPIGSIQSESLNISDDAYNERHKINLKEQKEDKIDPIYSSNLPYYAYNVKASDYYLKKLLDLTVQKAINSGADGIINLKYNPIYDGNRIDGWIISGMAIKRQY